MFNQTFSPDRPIIFPATWSTGKTQLQLYEEWKSTFEFSVLRLVLELGASSLLIFLITVIAIALKQLYRIFKLDEEVMQKRVNKKYLKPSFILPLTFIWLFCLTIFVLLMIQDWTRIVLLKGLVFCFFSYSLVALFKKIKPNLNRFRLKLKAYFKKSKAKQESHSQ